MLFETFNSQILVNLRKVARFLLCISSSMLDKNVKGCFTFIYIFCSLIWLNLPRIIAMLATSQNWPSPSKKKKHSLKTILAILVFYIHFFLLRYRALASDINRVPIDVFCVVLFFLYFAILVLKFISFCHQLIMENPLISLWALFLLVWCWQEIWNYRHQQYFLSWLLPTLSSPWRTASSASWSLSSSVSTYSFNTSTTPEVGGKPSVNPRVVLTASASFSCSCTHSTFWSSTGFSKCSKSKLTLKAAAAAAKDMQKEVEISVKKKEEVVPKAQSWICNENG